MTSTAPGRSAARAEAADRHAHRGCTDRECAGNGKSAVAPAAAQRLHFDPVGVKPLSEDSSCAGDGNPRCRSRGTPKAADRDRARPADTLNGTGACHRKTEAAVAAPTAYRLRHDTAGIFESRADIAKARYLDLPRGTAGTTAAADRNTEPRKSAQGDIAAETAVAASTTDRLRQNAVCVVAGNSRLTRGQIAGGIHRHCRGAAASASAAADVDARSTPNSERQADGGSTVAASAADRLRDNCTGLIAVRRDVSLADNIYRRTVTAPGAVSADSNRRRHAANAKGSRTGEAATTASTAH